MQHDEKKEEKSDGDGMEHDELLAEKKDDKDEKKEQKSDGDGMERDECVSGKKDDEKKCKASTKKQTNN